MNPLPERPLSAITVAGIVYRDHQFLMVEELIAGHNKLNQPAGHVEPGESLIDAVVREVLEETRYRFHPEALLGIYHSNPLEGHRILRVAIIGSVDAEPDHDPLDRGILAVHWLDNQTIETQRTSLRSPFVTLCVQDYLRGQRFDLATLHSLTGAA
ncbi:MAG: NUDIX domain-containing protein [Halothiobacillus sp.]